MTLGDRVAVLRDGTVQQCDTPERLFEAPANVFVAAFMGSPAMNLAPGELRDGRLHVAGIEVPLPAAPAARRARDRRDPADRPQARGADDDPDAPRLRAELEVVERLGSESHVIFPVDAEKPAGEAAAAAEEATEDSDATLLADDDRARFTAVDPGPAPLLARRGGRARRAARRAAPVRPGDRRRAAVSGGSRRSPACSATRRPRGRASRWRESAQRLWRLAYAYRRLHALAVDALPRTPEWEVKCALGLRIWLDAEHAAALERRLGELRPPVGRRRHRARRAAGARVRRARARARHRRAARGGRPGRARGARALRSRPTWPTANPLADHPVGARSSRRRCATSERTLQWSRAAAAAVPVRAATGRATVAALLAAAGGLLGDAPAAAPPGAAALRCAAGPPRARSRGAPRRALRRPVQPVGADRRVLRGRARGRPTSGRTRSRTSGCGRWTSRSGWRRSSATRAIQPFERRRALSRQLWDETRHAMMGEVALERQGVPFHSFPIEIAGLDGAQHALQRRARPTCCCG